jgi:hypothetical protein
MIGSTDQISCILTKITKWAISNITVVLTKVTLTKITYDIYYSFKSYTFTNVMPSNIDADSSYKLQKDIMLYL